MADHTVTTSAGSCLGLTCLKWRDDGELTALDLARVLDRLARVDQDVAALCQHSLGQQVMAAATADEVLQNGRALGYEFSGDELLRIGGQKVGRVSVTNQEIPGEYN